MKELKNFVLATHNKDKLKEFQAFLQEFNVELKSLDDFNIGDIPETGTTLKDNALIKAETVYNKLKQPVISDDTGLEIEYLDNAPGVYSARFAGENCSYQDNVHKVLKLMKNVPDNERNAVFKTVLCIYFSPDEIYYLEGICKGVILKKQRGENGFGYDPVFFYPEYDKTFAEMDLKTKNEISHRGKALQKLYDFLKEKY